MFDIPFETIFFYLFAAISIVFTFLAVTVQKLVHSAVALMLVLTTSAAFYIMLGAEFMAGVQILLYVGGVLILVVFAIMVTSSHELKQEAPTVKRNFAAIFAAVAFFITSFYVFTNDFFNVTNKTLPQDEIGAIGKSFLNYSKNGQILSFELISIILLAALIGGIVIGRKDDDQGSKS
ncbi:MAG: NADH-quinone oxidoreductase subunit J [Halobacteriovoraceae bacterium]|nr:NADH-quinone oxidoreductase subunit J [Halobacteriovoraceae bacterium]